MPLHSAYVPEIKLRVSWKPGKHFASRATSSAPKVRSECAQFGHNPPKPICTHLSSGPFSITSDTIQVSWHQKSRSGISPVEAFSLHTAGEWLYSLASIPHEVSPVYQPPSEQPMLEPASCGTSAAKDSFYHYLVLWYPSFQPMPRLPAQDAPCSLPALSSLRNIVCLPAP